MREFDEKVWQAEVRQELRDIWQFLQEELEEIKLEMLDVETAMSMQIAEIMVNTPDTKKLNAFGKIMEFVTNADHKLKEESNFF